jgi:hypothetical protein
MIMSPMTHEALQSGIYMMNIIVSHVKFAFLNNKHQHRINMYVGNG